MSRWTVDEATGCWLWNGPLDKDGYGVLYFAGKSHRAHRVAFALHVRGIRSLLTVDHLCFTRSCVNPEHLRLVSHSENASRQRAKGANKTHCKNGHEFTAANTYVRPQGGRDFRACASARQRVYAAKKKNPRPEKEAT